MNWSLQYHQILDAWTPTLEALPRWISANAYPSINEYIPFPNLYSLPSTGTLTLASSGVIPTSWVLSEPNTDKTATNNLQRVISSLVSEFQYMLPSLQATYVSRGLGVDTSEPDHAWYTSYSDSFTSVQVQSATGYVPIELTKSDITLFNSPTWKIKQVDNEFLIYGVQLQQQQSINHGTGYQFLANNVTYDPSSVGYWKHPITGTWIPFLNGQIRSDGLLGIYYPNSVYVRSISKAAERSLDTINLKFDNSVIAASRVKLWNTADESGLLFLLRRLNGETTDTFADKVYSTSWFVKDQRTVGMLSSIAIALGNYVVSTLTPGATGITDSNYSNFIVKDSLQLETILEVITYTGTGTLLSNYNNVVRGTAFINDNPYQVTNNNGVITLPGYNPRPSDRIVIYWMVNNWASNGNTLTMYPNTYSNSSNFYVLKTRKVDVENNNEDLRIKAFSKWPGLIWQNNTENENKVSGLAVFE